MDTDSCFLTPPLSGEYPVLSKHFSRISKADFEKPVFTLNEEGEEYEKSSDDKVDFLTELCQKSLVGTVCCKILEQLDDKDLIKASHVSRRWRSIIRYMDLKSGRRTSRFLRKIKKLYGIEKENRKLPKLKEHTIPSSIRTPLSSTSENVPINTSLSKVYEQTDNIFKTPVPVSKTKEVYSQCPECQSPARTTFKKAGYCKRCNHDFCIHCFYLKNTHSPTCQVVGGPGVTCSPRKATNSNRRQSVGSKESKSRLKRL